MFRLLKKSLQEINFIHIEGLILLDEFPKISYDKEENLETILHNRNVFESKKGDVFDKQRKKEERNKK